jgi:hypothetical protein
MEPLDGSEPDDHHRGGEHQAKAARHRSEDTTTPCATPRTFVYLLEPASGC